MALEGCAKKSHPHEKFLRRTGYSAGGECVHVTYPVGLPMARTQVLWLLSACIFFVPGAQASVGELAKEFHEELNAVDRQTVPDQAARLLLQVQPQYRSKELQIKGMYRDILESKEYESLRVDYFAKAFSEQQLQELVVLAKNPVFKLYQAKMGELTQFSGTALMQLVQGRMSQLNSPTLKPESAVQSNDRKTFYSEDYGNFFINTWMYLDKENERIFRVSFSVDKPRGSETSYFLYCAMRKFALTNGFDGWVLNPDEESDGRRGRVGFFRKGEEVVKVLGDRFAKSESVDAKNQSMFSFCTDAGNQAKAQNSPHSDPAVQRRP